MKTWNKEEDDKIISLFEEGKTYAYICNELGVTDGVLRSRIRKIGVNKKTFKVKNKKRLNCDLSFNYNVNSKKERDKKFCSNSCSASYNNKLRPKSGCADCKNCSSKLEKAHKKYCDNKCQGEYKRKVIFEKIENGDTGLYYTNYRNYLIEKFGDICMNCGWREIHPITGLVPIQLDHIDGDSDNNDLKNLRLLCPNCHSLTVNFGRLNNSGRSKRKDYRKNYRNKQV